MKGLKESTQLVANFIWNAFFSQQMDGCFCEKTVEEIWLFGVIKMGHNFETAPVFFLTFSVFRSFFCMLMINFISDFYCCLLTEGVLGCFLLLLFLITRRWRSYKLSPNCVCMVVIKGCIVQQLLPFLLDKNSWWESLLLITCAKQYNWTSIGTQLRSCLII